MGLSHTDKQALKTIQDILEYAHDLAMEARLPFAAIAIMTAYIECAPEAQIAADFLKASGS